MDKTQKTAHDPAYDLPNSEVGHADLKPGASGLLCKTFLEGLEKHRQEVRKNNTTSFFNR